MKKYSLLVGLFVAVASFATFAPRADAGTLYRVDTGTVASGITRTSAIIGSTVFGTTTIISPVVTSVGFTGTFGPDVVYTGSWSVTSFPVTATLTGLTCGTRYTYQAFATTIDGTMRGSTSSFTTTSCTPVAPSVQINSATLSGSVVTVVGQVNDLGTSPSVNVAFSATPLIGTATSFTVASGYGTQTVFTGTGTTNGLFTATYSTTCGTAPVTYTFNSTATGIDGLARSTITGPTGYQSKTVTVPACPILPPVIDVISAVATSQTTATVTANISSLGTSGSSVALREVDAVAGTTTRSWTEHGTFGTGTFSGNITGLTCATHYLATASMQNYASVTTPSFVNLYFDTPACTPPVLPTVVTVSATAVTATTATFNGSISAEYPNATTIGFGYNTSTTTTTGTDPSISASGSYATGPFSLNISGLTCNTTYHFRAYATNTVGQGWGSDLTFTTSACPVTLPVVTTNPAGSITTNSAFLFGTLISLGGAVNTTAYFDYGTTTAYGVHLTAGAPGQPMTATGLFSTAPSMFVCGTLYHFRASATNTAGTAYGSDLTFTTLPCPVGLPTVVTTAATTVTSSSATLNGSLTNLGGSPSVTVGFNYGTTTAYGSIATVATPLTTTGVFNKGLTGLTCNTMYHYQAYGTNTAGTAYGSDLTFTTSACPVGLAVVTTDTATSITTSSGTINGTITSTGGATVTARGFNYGTTTAYGSTGTSTGSFGVGSFSANETGLTCNTTYHYRAFATNTAGTAYGSDLTFTTLPCPVGLPTVVTTAATTIAMTSATLNGSITATGGVNATTRGFNYGTTTAYGTTSSTTGSYGVGAFSSALTSLVCNTTYHYQAFATNTSGTAYGSDLTFTTSACPIGIPTVVTNSATSVALTTATLNGAITATGGSTIIGRGFNYGTTTAYGATAGTTGSYGVGAFSNDLTGLSCGTTYHYRAFGTNSAGAGFGSDLTFTTSACMIAPPVVVTNAASSITDTYAQLNGSVTVIGSGSTDAYAGFNYGTTTAYGMTLSAFPVLSAPGSFLSNAISLDCNTLYHYQAYAMNTLGATGYGADMTFTTNPCITGASVATTSSSGITMTSANLYGNLLSDGGDPSTVTYFDYDTTTTYSMSTSGISHGVGSFNDSITGLTCGTLYHFRASAFNSFGSTHGADMTFTTSSCPVSLPTVATVSATSVTSTGATFNGSLTSTGGALSTTTGFNYGTTTSYGNTLTYGVLSSASPFNSSTSSLICNTLYHFHAFATNTAGTAYGSDMSFTTSPCPVGLPTVVTNSATAVTGTTAVMNGAITLTGGANAIAVGFNYGTTTSYGTTSTTTGSFGVTSFATGLTSLSCNATYHYRAFAINSAGTTYGGDVSLTTTPCLAMVATTGSSSITQTAGTLSGNLTNLGGASSATVGFNYGTTTSYGSTATYGSLSGSSVFSSTVSSLTCNTLYHFRAFATNTAGSAYGTDMTFTTLPCNPTVVTVSASMASISTATFVGNLTATGGTGVVNNVGFNYGPTTAYGTTIPASAPTGGIRSTAGPFTVVVSGLPTTGGAVAGDPLRSAISCNLPWHMRAFATNTGGTAYGADVSFCN